MAKRESLILKNISSKIINIGDLSRIPSISPGKSVDALLYYSKEEINQSENLIYLCKASLLSIKSVNDSVSTTISSQNIEEALTVASKTDVGNNTGGHDDTKLDKTGGTLTGDLILDSCSISTGQGSITTTNINLNGSVGFLNGTTTITGTDTGPVYLGDPSDGLALIDQSNNSLVWNSGLSLQGQNINMNLAGGMGGGNINMDGGSIQFSNISGNYGSGTGSIITTGSFDAGHGGNGGLSMVCAVGFELNWQAGYLSCSYNNGGVFSNINMDRTGFNLLGNTINMNSGGGSGGGTINFDNGVIRGLAQVYSNYSGIDFFAGIALHGNFLYMNGGSGSGGGNLLMDGGYIKSNLIQGPLNLTAATGSLGIGGGSVDGQTIEINDGNGNDITFTYRTSPSAPHEFNFITPGFGSYFLATIINASGIGITAVYDNNVTINLTNNIPGAAGNVAIINNVTGLTVSGMSGGVTGPPKYQLSADGRATFGNAVDDNTSTIQVGSSSYADPLPGVECDLKLGGGKGMAINSFLTLTPIATPTTTAEGMIYLNTSHQLKIYLNGAWKTIGVS